MSNQFFKPLTIALCGTTLVACGGGDNDKDSGPSVGSLPAINQNLDSTTPEGIWMLISDISRSVVRENSDRLSSDEEDWNIKNDEASKE